MALSTGCLLGMMMIFDLVPQSGICDPAELPQLDSLRGGQFGAAVIDLSGGQVLASTGEGLYPLEGNRLLLISYASSVITGGDHLFSPSEEDSTLAAGILERLLLDDPPRHLALSNDDSLLVRSWMELEGFQASLSPMEGSGSIMIPLEDACIIVDMLHSGMENMAVALLLGSPDLGEGQASSVGSGAALNGLVDSGTGHRSFILIHSGEESGDLGLVLLDRDLCCTGKADLALMILWNAASLF